MMLGAGGWFACSTGARPVPDAQEGDVATTRQALDPGWTPRNLPSQLPLLAWYIAGADNVLPRSGPAVQTWVDLSGNGNDVTEDVGGAQPQYQEHGWAGDQPTLSFNGNNILFRNSWSGPAPAGTDTPITVMAVVQPTAATDGEVASWWDPNGTGWAWAGVKVADSRILPDVGRLYGLSDLQTYTGPHDLGYRRTTDPATTAEHVIVWRYVPASQTITLTVDGTTTTSASIPPINALSGTPFYVGAATSLPTKLFSGNISELVVVGGNVGDTDVQNLSAYAQAQWHGLPTQASTNPCLDVNGQPIALAGIRCDDQNASTYGDQCVNGTCVGAVPPSGNPATLAPSAWYHAGAQEVSKRDGTVEVWFDRTAHRLDLSNGFYFSRPGLTPGGWSSGKDTISFGGHHILDRRAWTGIPDGTDSEFTVLAVVQQAAGVTTQSAGLASWWSLNGAGRIGCDLKTSGSATVLDLFRIDLWGANQEYVGSGDLASAKHVLAWRYSPGRMQLTIDGVNARNTNLPTAGELEPEIFLVGTDSEFANNMLKAELAELVVVPRSISDGELATYNGYVGSEWGGIAPCAPSCAGKTCGADNGCGGTCDCGPCTTDAQCNPGFSCVNQNCGEPGLPAHCSNGTLDGDETGVDCGGSCTGCAVNTECQSDADCASGLACGQHNGGCFDGSRAKNVCWPSQCADDYVQQTTCGNADSACGSNCACVKGCSVDDPSAACASGDVCREGIGTLFSAVTRDVCIPAGVTCPSNDPAYCGTEWSLCGADCIPLPDCSHATCDNPSDGAGGICRGVCPLGGSGPTGGTCTNDVECQVGASCHPDSDGLRRCRRDDLCPPGPLAPPLCGSPTAPCGAVCPTNTPQCQGRQCGTDPVFGQNCGTCADGSSCSAGGHCAQRVSRSQPLVPDGHGGTVPLEDLPTTPASPVGAVAGTFSVSEGGTAEYDIPIEVPPGRAGMVPTLSLHYMGANRSTDQGVGWTLAGLSKITRCPGTQAFDGFAVPIKNDNTDAFCLDGQRLVAVHGGTYGADGTQYRTAVDSFSKVTSRRDPDDQAIQAFDPFAGVTRIDRSLQGPDYFVVQTREGRTLTFGHTATSLGVADNGLRYSWLLNEVRDRAGNTIEVDYTNDGGTFVLGDGTELFPSHFHPSVISYTGHGQTPGNRHVRFSYEDRSDPFYRFEPNGLYTSERQRLHSVTTYVDTSAVRTYLLHYPTQYISQMDSITECAGDGSDASQCKPPTTFSYRQEGGFSPLANAGIDLSAALLLDANGDGRQDFFHTYVTVDGVPANPALEAASIITNEVGNIVIGATLSTGVGIPVGIIFSLLNNFFWGAFAKEPTVRYNDVLTFTQPDRTLNGVTANGLPDGANGTGAPLYLLDYDRDGKDDVAGYYGYSAVPVSPRQGGPAPTLALRRSRGDGTFDLVQLGSDVSSLSHTNATEASGLPAPVVYDIDGDGLQDIISCADKSTIQMRRRQSALGGFEAPVVYTTVVPSPNPRDPPTGPSIPFCETSRPTYNIIDVDGDGVADLLFRSSSGWKVLRYTPGGAPPLTFETVAFTDTDGSESGHGLILGDFNGDGLIDIASLVDSHANLWINTGRRHFLSRSVPRPAPAQAQQGFTYRRAAILDYDGDGRADFFEHWQSSDPNIRDFNYNVALTPDGDWTVLTPKEDTSIIGQMADGSPRPGGFSVAADIDGDGNIDVFGPDGFFFGSGAQNTLLERVVDGLGNVTRVTYGGYKDACPASSSSTAVAGSTWPETCLHTMTGVVSSVQYGYVEDNQDQIEKTDTYNFTNAHVSVAGAGWLGFESRRVDESDFSGNSIFRTTTTQYELPQRYGRDGSPRTDTNSGYIYPLTGHVHSVTTVQRVSGTPGIAMPLESADFEQVTEVDNHWSVSQSTASVPFVELDERDTTVSAQQVDPIALGQQPTPHDPIVVATRTETFQTDGYGNVYSASDADVSETRTTTTTFWPADEDNWIVSNPQDVTITSTTNYGAPVTQQTHTDFDSRGLLHAITRAPSGPTDQYHATTYVRDDYGNPYQIIDSVMTGELARTTQIVYDNDNIFPITIINPLNQQSQVQYDDRWGTLDSTVDPNGIATQYGYDALGLRVRTEDPNGTTTYAYSALPLASTNGRLPFGIIHPRVSVTQTRVGVAQTTTGTVTRELDNHGRLVRNSASGLGATVVQEQTFDQRGRPYRASLPHTSAENPQPYTENSYDEMDRVIAIRHSDGASSGGPTEQFEYANATTLDSQYSYWLQKFECGYPLGCPLDILLKEDASGNQNVTISDHRGQIIRAFDGNNITPTTVGVSGSGGDGITPVTFQYYTSYLYGGFGQLLTMFDNSEMDNSGVDDAQYDPIRTDFGYDPYGRMFSHRSADTGLTQTTYNGFDQPVLTSDANGRNRIYTYDDLGRNSTILDDGDHTTSWTYDVGANAIGRLTRMTSPGSQAYPNGQTVDYTYEPVTARNRGLVQHVTYTLDGIAHDIGFSYDDLGRTKRIDYPTLGQGLPIAASYTYDPSSGTLERVDEVSGSTTKALWQLNTAFEGYLAATETFGNGVTTTYQYEPARHWLGSIQTVQPTAASQQTPPPLQNLGYTYYDNGQVHVRTSFDGTQTTTRTHTYDSLMRLRNVEDDRDGPLPTVTSTNYSYDNYGNLVHRGDSTIVADASRPHLVDSVDSNQYLYDAKGNLIQRSDPVHGPEFIYYTPFDLPDSIIGGSPTYFEYTADAERIIRRDRDKTRYFVNGLYERVADTSGNTTEERIRIYAGERELAEIVRANGSDQTLFFHADNIGTVETITNDAGGVLRQKFDPFGAEDSPLNPEVTRVGFTGQEHDRDLGLIDMQGRIYDPYAGRFAQPDPLMQNPYWSQGLNRYAYVFNDPINHTDPSGLKVRFGDFLDVFQGALVTAWIPGGVLASVGAGGLAGIGLNLAAGSAAEVGLGFGMGVPGAAQAGMPTTAVPPGLLQAGDSTRLFERLGDEVGQEGRSAVGPRYKPAPGQFLVPAGNDLYKLSPEGRDKLRVLDHTGFDLNRLRFRFRSMEGDHSGETRGDLINLNTAWDTYTPDSQVHTLAHEATHAVQVDKLGILRTTMRHAVEAAKGELTGVSPYTQSIDLLNASAKALDPVDSRFPLEAIADKMGDAAIGYGE
jgi:RHS repeat-associated protein